MLPFFIKKVSPLIASLGIFYYIIFFTPYPQSWQVATTQQILSFFLPLLAFFTFLFNLFIRYLPKSFILALAIMFLIVLYSINQFNFLTVPLVIIFCVFLLEKFPKIFYPRLRLPKPLRSLTSRSKIHKMTNLGGKKSR